MYSLLYKLYYFLRRVQKKRISKKDPLYRLSEFLIGYLEAYYNLYVVRQYKNRSYDKSGVTEEKRDQKTIVSLTSFPARINVVWIAIETLLRQSMKPDEIVLWLAEDQFPNKEKDLPEKLLKQKDRGLTIRFCDDLRSHKKYFYTMQEYPNDLIILADDDLFYPYNTIAMLIKLHKKYPKDICCLSSQHIGENWNTMPSTWRNPYLYENNEHSSRIQVYTGSGSLFPPGCLYKDAFNKDKMISMCFSADDLWLTYMAHLKGSRITSLNKWQSFPIEVYGTSANSLWYENAEMGMNDIQWAKLLNHYNNDPSF